MNYGNDRLATTAIGAAFVVIWLIVRSLKRRLAKPKSDTFRCCRCRKAAKHDIRTIEAWRSGKRSLFCQECHRKWRESHPAVESHPGGGCLGAVVVSIALVALVARGSCR